MKRRTLLLSSLFSLSTLSVERASAQASEVEIEVEAAPTPAEAAAPPASPPSPTQAEVEALRTQLLTLEQRLGASEAAQKAAAERESMLRSESERASEEREQKRLLDRVAKAGVSLSGYVQVQYGQNELSQDQLLQGGTPLNQDRFAVRRGRIRLKGRWKYARTDFELDASTTRGPTASVRRASVSGVLPSADESDPPLLVLTAGLTEIPFGLELQQGQDEILFLERTSGSLAFFSGPVDTGLRLDAAYGPFRAQLAVMNGVPLDDRAGGPSGIDPTKAPDLVGRLGVDASPLESFRVAGGVSFLSGRGFHGGSDATKSVLQWDDSNADGTINAGELVAVAGRGALPSEKFKHWAVGADLAFELQTGIGWTRLYGELVLASNLDRSFYVADPLVTGNDLRELNWYVAAVQDVTAWSFVGVRYDEYDPDSDLIDTRRGESVPADASLKTISPIVGARWPGYGRVTFEYDWVRDKLARDKRGVPTDVANNAWTLRVQGEF